MNGIELKKIWHSGTPSLGTWITLADPVICAMTANVGFEWVLIDGEHNPFNPETLRNMIMTLQSRGCAPIVRIRVNDESLVKQMLDWGAEGVMFPMIHDAADARRAVAACRYPPHGVRGFSPREASNFYKDLDSYLATADERVIAMLQIEHYAAVDNLDEILTVPGIDALLIGPADLSYSLDVPFRSIIQRCRKPSTRLFARPGPPASQSVWPGTIHRKDSGTISSVVSTSSWPAVIPISSPTQRPAFSRP